MKDKRFSIDNEWDDGVYGTGCTQPPKSHRAFMGVLRLGLLHGVGNC
mgnify:CR=1 FL=1